MKGWVERSIRTRTLSTTLVLLFGFASVVLVCLGLYGTVSYASRLRQREFGIRLALGATGLEVFGPYFGTPRRLSVPGCWQALFFAGLQHMQFVACFMVLVRSMVLSGCLHRCC